METLLSFGFRRRHQRILAPAFIAMFCMLWPGSAAAHRVTIFAWVEGEIVYTESKFSGGKPVKEGDVLVYDLDGNQLLSGKTDAQGGFSFTLPKKTGMRIVLQAGMGHRGEWTMPAGEVTPGEPKPEPTATRESPPGTSGSPAATSGVSLDQVRLVVEQSLDRKLGPGLKMLAERQDSGPTLRDILGGMGYILGLMGLAAYIHFRRKADDIAGKRKG